MTEQPADERETSYFDSSETPADESEPGTSDEGSYFEPAEVDPGAVQITSPAPEAVGHQTRYSRTVGEGDGERFFPARTLEEAAASIEAIEAYCRNCPLLTHCPEEECAVYRAEAIALAKLDEGRTAVGGVVIPAAAGA